MEPLVSIVAANYNCANYIDDFIKSVLAQTYTNWELIIVDDGSTDASQDIVKRHSANDDRIHLIIRTKDPKGANHCRNIGLDTAKGKYICFFDSDDLIPEYAIKDRVHEMESNPHMDFIVFPAITFREKPYDYNNLVIGANTSYDSVAMFLRRYRLPFAVWTNIYKLDFFKQSDIKWDNYLLSMQDSDLNLTILSTPVQYMYSNAQRPSYFWRKIENGSNITQTIKSVKNLESQLYFFNKLHELYGGTKYAKDVSCFKLTLLHRTIYLGYDKIPSVLLNNKADNLKYTIAKSLLSCIKIRNEKLSYSIFMSLYPIRFIEELLYRYRNSRQVHHYMSKWGSRLN